MKKKEVKKRQGRPAPRRENVGRPPVPGQRARPAANSRIDISIEGARSRPQEAQVRRVTRSEARKKRRRQRIIAILAALLMVGVGFLLSMTVLFPIQDFRVEGESVYSAEELQNAFGVPAGENIFRFHIAQAEQTMAKALPYLETIKVRRSLPGTVVFIITPATETYYMNTGATNLVLSKERKVLRMVDMPPEGLCQITGVQAAQDNQVGQALRCAEEADQEKLDTLLEGLDKWFPEGVTAVDVTDPLEMSFTYQNRLVVKIGTGSQLDYKLQLSAKTIQDELGAEERGTMDASYPGKVYVSNEIS